MNENYLSEKIGIIKNEMSHIWGGIFITGGGAITIATTGYSHMKIVLIVLGLLMAMIFINAYLIREIELFKILKQLNKEEE